MDQQVYNVLFNQINGKQKLMIVKENEKIGEMIKNYLESIKKLIY